MTPTMVEKDGKLFLILGTPGGSTIITTVYRLIIQVIDQKMTMNEAVAVKRFHHQWLPDVIFYEEGALTPGMREELKRMGYELRLRGYIGRADCIRILPDGSIEAAPDPRGDDTAAGY
jgi:gamma-glutamyltranspeptidase/glutathione hydrolase